MTSRGMGALVALTTFVVLAACSKKTPEPEKASDAAASALSASSAASTASAPSASASGRQARYKVGESCEGSSFANNDCEKRPGCDTKCMAIFDDHSKKTGSRCFLIAPNGHEGSSPCVADIDGTSYAYYGKEGAERGVACDVVHNGVFCDKASRVCTKTKALGADCLAHAECGKDGACDAKTKKCVPSSLAGAKCTEFRCNSSAYCERKSNQCIAKKTDGALCGASDECASLRCNAVCQPAQAPDVCALN